MAALDLHDVLPGRPRAEHEPAVGVGAVGVDHGADVAAGHLAELDGQAGGDRLVAPGVVEPAGHLGGRRRRLRLRLRTGEACREQKRDDQHGERTSHEDLLER